MSEGVKPRGGKVLSIRFSIDAQVVVVSKRSFSEERSPGERYFDMVLVYRKPQV